MGDGRKPYDDDGPGAHESDAPRAYGRGGTGGAEGASRTGWDAGGGEGADRMEQDAGGGESADRTARGAWGAVRAGGRDSGDRGGSGDRRRRGGPARLPEELRAFGRSLDPPGGADGSETMVERVLGQILAEQVPVPVAGPTGAAERLRAVRRWTRRRWRSLTAALCGLLTVLVLTPPVRAAVLDWFDFAGVGVRYDPSAAPSPGAEVPGCNRPVSLAEAGRRAGFEPLVPKELGAPDAVSVTGEPRGRFLVSLCWHEDGRTIRLDERRASLDIGFAKTVREPPEWIPLDPGASNGTADDQALWFARPHLLTFWLVDASGERFTREERTAGPTLLWTHSAKAESVALRLEGVASPERALAVARSVERAS